MKATQFTAKITSTLIFKHRMGGDPYCYHFYFPQFYDGDGLIDIIHIYKSNNQIVSIIGQL
ncbi:hypothetical protein DERF_009412 [Dermatophagoides farinae]|uniref:Uncharacterized protein n=1 Tax=Dermatophagoides farinae TaxID=6954 RepID=A0A922L1G9_DERFA|nr:hypothetical protein DERF_009412 [Dermatophagoides farinae]